MICIRCPIGEPRIGQQRQLYDDQRICGRLLRMQHQIEPLDLPDTVDAQRESKKSDKYIVILFLHIGR